MVCRVETVLTVLAHITTIFDATAGQIYVKMVIIYNRGNIGVNPM